MSLPPLATVADMEKRLGLVPGSLSGADLARAGAALEDVSALVRLEAGADWVAEDGATITAPPAVVTVVLAAALRGYRNPDGFQGETVGPYSYQYAQGATSAYLTAQELRLIRAASGNSAASVYTLRTPSAYSEPTRSPSGIYLEL
ncbi:hypothetical protein [Micromonospora sp. NPDC023956]|uniref:hypothetical protein n=1 Tax=Micromonospora sp. NPDC023956 TaxID=3155722 RepID=UPI00340BD673